MNSVKKQNNLKRHTGSNEQRYTSKILVATQKNATSKILVASQTKCQVNCFWQMLKRNK